MFNPDKYWRLIMVNCGSAQNKRVSYVWRNSSHVFFFPSCFCLPQHLPPFFTLFGMTCLLIFTNSCLRVLQRSLTLSSRAKIEKTYFHILTSSAIRSTGMALLAHCPLGAIEGLLHKICLYFSGKRRSQCNCTGVQIHT